MNDCLTMTKDGSKRTNDTSRLHSQKHYGVTDKRPITSQLRLRIISSYGENACSKITLHDGQGSCAP